MFGFSTCQAIRHSLPHPSPSIVLPILRRVARCAPCDSLGARYFGPFSRTGTLLSSCLGVGDDSVCWSSKPLVALVAVAATLAWSRRWRACRRHEAACCVKVKVKVEVAGITQVTGIVEIFEAETPEHVVVSAQRSAADCVGSIRLERTVSGSCGACQSNQRRPTSTTVTAPRSGPVSLRPSACGDRGTTCVSL